MTHQKKDGVRVGDLPPMQIRILPEIKEWIANQAKNNHRSFAGEVNYRLEQVIKQHEAV